MSMEDQAEKTEALKKAYAEIILNTAKEAAARAMVSECKVLRFHHDLRNTKDEALRMTLRMKQMIDAKTTEAEMASLGQQKRIEELDAQLNEAEVVIVDLRAELKKARERLEEVRNRHMLQSNGPSENEHIRHFENTAHDKKLDVTEQLRSSSQSGRSCNSAIETTTSSRLSDKLCIGKPNLASIIIGSKEPEFSRNGYTHRIRAIERNLEDGKNISSDKPAVDICTKRELIVNVDERSCGKCAPLSIDIENTYANTDMKNTNESGALSVKSSVAKDQTVKNQRLPINSVRYAPSNPKHSQFSRGQSVKPTTEPQKVNLEEKSLGKDEKSTENNEKSACALRRSVRKRKVRCWDEISSLFKSRAALSHCKNYSGNDSGKFDEHRYKFKSVAEINEVIIPMSSATNAFEETNNDDSPRPLHINAFEDTKLQNESVVEKHEVGRKESAGVSTCNSVAEADKVLGTDSIPAEYAGGTACDADKKSRLKYTFSRKRKKALFSKSDNCSSLGKSFSIHKMGEKPSFAPENEKHNMIEDQSHDSQNMVEVACQLISLSGERSR